MVTKWFAVLLLLLTPAFANAAAFTSKADGNWSASGQTTWNESGVPGNNDTVTIATGHDITVDVNTTVGDSPSTPANVITVNGTGTLTVATGVTFIIKGCYRGEDGNFTLGAGSIVEFQVPSTKRYWVRPNLAHSDTGKLIINGTIGSRAAFRSSSGAGIAYIDGNGQIGGSLVQASYCDFTRIGDGTEEFATPWLGGSGQDFFLRYCTLTSCGCLDFATNADANASFELTGTEWVTTVATKCAIVESYDAPASGKTRLIDGVTFDKTVDLFGTRKFAITNTYFADSYTGTLSNGEGWLTFENNLIAKAAQGPTILFGNASNCFVYKHSVSNPHFVQPEGDLDVTVSGCVFEHGGTQTDGDGVLLPASGGAHRYTITRNIVLSNSAGDNSCTLCSALGASAVTFSADHNTYFNNMTGSGGAIAETYTGFAGMLSSFRSNLAWSDTTLEAEVLQESGANSAVTGYVTNNGYNGCWNPRATRYDLDAGTVTNDLTAFDVTGDPAFVDETRDLASWDASLSGAGTNTAALARIAADPYLIGDLLTWVKAGFAVQAAAYDGTAHDGGIIGAMPYVASSGGGGFSAGVNNGPIR